MLNMISGRLFDHLEPKVVPVGLMDYNSRGNSKRLLDHIQRIVIMVQDALKQDYVETIIRERQAVCVRCEKKKGTRVAIARTDANGFEGRIGRYKTGGRSAVPESDVVESVSACHIQNRTIPEFVCFENNVCSPAGGEPATQTVGARIEIAFVVGSILLEGFDIGPVQF